MYTQQFQREVVKLTATNLKFATHYASLLNPEYFDTKALKILFKMINDYVITYEKEVELDDVLIKIEDYVENRGFSDDVYSLLKNESKEVFKVYIKSEQFIIDQLVDYVKFQRVSNAVGESIEVLEKSKNYEHVLKLIDDAVSTGYGIDEGLTFDDMMNLPDLYNKRYRPENLIRTGITGFDRALMGGMAPGEIHVIQSPPKSGKSTLGCSIGANILKTGKIVYHITLEIKDIDVLGKYASRITGFTQDQLVGCPEKEYHEKLKEYNDLKPRLFIKYWTEGSVNCLTIRSWITRKRSQTGMSPDVIIIDYDDCLLPTDSRIKDDMYNEAGSIYSDMINLADYFKCPIITFAQPQRHTWGKMENGELIYSYELAHSARKAHKAYSISSLNFKPDSDIGILFADSLRRGKSGTKIKLKRDLSRAKFLEHF